MKVLSNLLKNLESKKEVDAAFLTGSHGIGMAKPYSDLDLVIILDENKTDIRFVYEKIDGVFSDIYFFDKSEIETLLSTRKTSGSSWGGILITWLKKANIKFDKSGLVSKLKEKASEIDLIIPENEKNETHNKISNNFFRNKRYFYSNDPVYHEALALPLMYSVVEMFYGFLSLRDEPWQGEKHAIKYISKVSPEFYGLFREFQGAVSLEEKMRIYTAMVHKVLPENLKIFDYEDFVAMAKTNNTSQEMERQNQFWNKIAL